MEKSKAHYWAIYENGAAVFEGTYSECWKELMRQYENYLVSALVSNGVCIKRKCSRSQSGVESCR
jgi:hypothetical protein